MIINKPESVQGDEMHLLDFEIQTDYVILTRRADLVLIKCEEKKTCHLVYFDILPEHRVDIK